MCSIQVIKDTSSCPQGVPADLVFPDSLPEPSQMKQLSDLCLKALEQACDNQVSILDIPPIPSDKKTSTMFQAISLLYKTMRSFQSDHAYPKEIHIHCQDDHLTELYMMVWNLYYAEDKNSRMNDGRWD